MTPRLVDPEGIEPSGYRCERRLCPSVQEPKLGTPGWNRTTVIAVSGRYSTIEIRVRKLERSMGIEPTFEGWEPSSLPLTYDRVMVGAEGIEPTFFRLKGGYKAIVCYAPMNGPAEGN